MEIRDVIHGSIGLDRRELPVLDSRHFQRLRQIKQLGFAEYSYPNATHNRYIHSLGALETATRAFDTIFGSAIKSSTRPRQYAADRLNLADLAPSAFARLRAVTRLAALLHDIGHGPLSHTTEFAMPEARALQIPGGVIGRQNRQATHEDYTLKIILDSSLTPLLEKAGVEHGFSPRHVATLIEPSIETEDGFYIEKIEGESVDFTPILRQLISSELDADRMDYLRRDSWHAGVSYGQFDFDWIVSNLTSHVRNGRCHLGLQHRALNAFEDFLISRFHMFMMVYFHYKSVVYDAMLAEYFGSDACDYVLPSDIEKYIDYTDAQLWSHLATSQNEWARRLSEKRPYRMLIELQSGIPATKTALIEQSRLLSRIQRELKAKGTHYLEKTSTGELSKYFRKPGDPIYVRYDNHYSAASFIPLEQCTDLFMRYSEKRTITRLYVSPEDFANSRSQGRELPLKYEEEIS